MTHYLPMCPVANGAFFAARLLCDRFERKAPLRAKESLKWTSRLRFIFCCSVSVLDEGLLRVGTMRTRVVICSYYNTIWVVRLVALGASLRPLPSKTYIWADRQIS